MSRRGGNDGGDGKSWWDAVKKTVTPLKQARERAAATDAEANVEANVEANAAKPRKAAPRAARPQQPLRPAAPRLAPQLPPLTGLDRRSRQRVVRGATGIDGRLDLHGYKQQQARDRLLHFLERAQDRGHSLILVITGKGTIAAADGERGVLKRQVPRWLAQPEFRALVIGFEEAATAHGGAGALYVRVRRKR